MRRKEFQHGIVIISGAGRGIGYAIAREFARRGARVVLNDIEEDLAEEAADRLNRETRSRRVASYPADISEPDCSREIIQFCQERFGTPNIGIANAGVTRFVKFLECDLQTFQQVVSVNLQGTFFFLQALAQTMVQEPEEEGRLIALSSVVGVRGFPAFSVYSMTKAGIGGLVRTLALELGSRNITVNAVSPGATLTERTLQDDPDYDRNWASVHPIRRVGKPEDVAACACFLASPAARQVTGQNIIVDGGWSAQGKIPSAHPELPAKQSDG